MDIYLALMVLILVSMAIGKNIERKGFKNNDFNINHIRLGSAIFLIPSIVLSLLIIVAAKHKLHIAFGIIICLACFWYAGDLRIRVIKRFKKINSWIHLIIGGTREDMKKYLPGLPTPPPLLPKEIFHQSLVRVKTILPLEDFPKFVMPRQIILDVSPDFFSDDEKEDFWRLVVQTSFGVKEEDVLGFLEQFDFWKDMEKVKHHSEFVGQKIHMHFFDSHIDNWNTRFTGKNSPDCPHCKE